MKIRITFTCDDDFRQALAYEYDGDEYDGKRLATRKELDRHLYSQALGGDDDIMYAYHCWLERKGQVADDE